jgi:hypothetical protein
MGSHLNCTAPLCLTGLTQLPMVLCVTFRWVFRPEGARQSPGWVNRIRFRSPERAQQALLARYLSPNLSLGFSGIVDENRMLLTRGCVR